MPNLSLVFLIDLFLTKMCNQNGLIKVYTVIEPMMETKFLVICICLLNVLSKNLNGSLCIFYWLFCKIISLIGRVPLLRIDDEVVGEESILSWLQTKV